MNSNSREYRNVIKHKAFVKEISESTLTVTILNQSACASCHAHGACTMADVREKEVEIKRDSGMYSPGQEVTVVFQESLGFKALIYGYIIPFLLVLTLLVSVFSFTGNEVTAGLSALGALIPYYITLYFFRGFLKNVFKFELE